MPHAYADNTHRCVPVSQHFVTGELGLVSPKQHVIK